MSASRAGAQYRAHPLGIRHQILRRHLADDGMADGAGEGVRCVSVAVQKAAGFGDRLDHLGRGKHRAHRRIAGGDALGQRH
jgi:hypothetical protein